MKTIKDIERNILKEIGTIARCINSISDINYKDINLQKGQFIYLIRICENPGVNQIHLSNLLKVDKTTTTRAIQKLINVGYIERKEDSSDKRMWRLYPLPKAIDTYKYIIEAENKSNKLYYDSLTEDEKELVYNLLKRLRQNIENDWSKTKKLTLEDEKMDLKMVETTSKNTDFTELTNLLDKDLNERYGELQKQYDKHNKVDHINDVVIIYKNQVPVACGAFKQYDENSAEIKRIFVRKENRRQGLAKQIMKQLEQLIRIKNYKYAILETGIKQTEAINLYKNIGYNIIQNYAPYVGNTNSICMKKVLS